jgi:hypothetical protein
LVGAQYAGDKAARNTHIAKILRTGTKFAADMAKPQEPPSRSRCRAYPAFNDDILAENVQCG